MCCPVKWPLTMVLVAALLPWTAVCAGEEAAPPPDWRQAMHEAGGTNAIFRVVVNDIDTLWNEFSRSQLYRAMAQDPAIAASTTKMVAEMDKRKAVIGKAIGKDDPDWLLAQGGKLGPFAMGVNMPDTFDIPDARLVVRHHCDAEFVKLVLDALGNARDLHLERLTTNDFVVPRKPFAYRLNGGETVLTPEAMGPNLYSNGQRFLIASQRSNEQALFLRAAQAATPSAEEEAFAAFMGKSRRWLSATEFNFPVLARMLAREGELTEVDMAAIFGQISPVYEKEIVNKANRFDTEIQYAGTDLAKGLLFFGSGQPVNTEVAQIFPDEMVLILHANYDMKKFMNVKPADLPGTSERFQRNIASMQADIRRNLNPEVKPGDKAIPGPVLTTGLSLLMLEPDRLEEFFNSFVFATGIEPGFKISEEWLKALPAAKNWDATGRPVKIVSYSGVDIGVIGENGWQQCFAVVGGVMAQGNNLKQVKRVVRYLNNVKKGEANPQKGMEWQHVTSLVEQDGFGTLQAFGLLKMDYLIKTLVPTGLGAGATLLPGLPTDVNWNDVAGRLQPATGVILYDPQKGMKGRLVSDLPLATLSSISSLASSIGFTADRGAYYFMQPDEEDLPAVGGRGGVMRPDGGPDWVEEAVPPEEAIQPDAVEAVPAEDAHVEPAPEAP